MQNINLNSAYNCRKRLQTRPDMSLEGKPVLDVGFSSEYRISSRQAGNVSGKGFGNKIPTARINQPFDFPIPAPTVTTVRRIYGPPPSKGTAWWDGQQINAHPQGRTPIRLHPWSGLKGGKGYLGWNGSFTNTGKADKICGSLKAGWCGTRGHKKPHIREMLGHACLTLIWQIMRKAAGDLRQKCTVQNGRWPNKSKL